MTDRDPDPTADSSPPEGPQETRGRRGIRPTHVAQAVEHAIGAVSRRELEASIARLLAVPVP